MVERNIVLPKHIILSDEEMGTRLYLGPNSLRPSQTLFSVTEDDTSFTVSLPRNITPGSGSSAAPSEEEGSDDDNQDGDEDGNGDEEGDPGEWRASGDDELREGVQCAHERLFAEDDGAHHVLHDQLRERDETQESQVWHAR